ncbi:MAG: AAA family ATPase [Halofilum sp. (in: g-proteobacteria)]|nr:AAA family ATPase [Halofilum sp. (in: g-proteobacteria)]
MHLTALDVRDLRIIASAAIEPGSRLNVIAGPNAAGKTSLLEAIHVLATGRSFAATRAGRAGAQRRRPAARGRAGRRARRARASPGPRARRLAAGRGCAWTGARWSG